jgi:hypothetical protein
MADTKVADIVKNNLFFPFVQEPSVYKSALISSAAVLRSDGSLQTGLSAGGSTFNYRSFTSIANDANDYNISSDDPTSDGTANKVSSEKQIVHRLDRNAIFSVTDMAAHLAGVDPMSAIVGEIGAYRAKQRQKIALGYLLGVTLKLNDGVDVAAEAIGSYTSATRIGPDSIIDAQAPWDDEVPEGLILVVHGDVYRRLQKDNLIDFTPTNVQDVGFGTYLSMTLVVDSTVPKTAGSTDGFKYTSYLLRPSALAMGVGTPKNPAEFERKALSSDGGGTEYLVIRDTLAFHVRGMSFAGAVVGLTPTIAEVSAAADWDKVWERKNIGVSYLITNA